MTRFFYFIFFARDCYCTWYRFMSMGRLRFFIFYLYQVLRICLYSLFSWLFSFLRIKVTACCSFFRFFFFFSLLLFAINRAFYVFVFVFLVVFCVFSFSLFSHDCGWTNSQKTDSNIVGSAKFGPPAGPVYGQRWHLASFLPIIPGVAYFFEAFTSVVRKVAHDATRCVVRGMWS